MNLGIGEIAVILIVALLIFGPNKLPKLGKAAGQALFEFKREMKDMMDMDDPATKKQNKNQ
ncbi:sec-independent protein translocase protein TatA [Bacillus tianshenii]|uniref:Sec-independent protein translocase protein TatA n=1 Tax=Sutcliffiella tianshenii TaxID=1463404 RepID=A0ABS2P3R8_9BACI|nr:twin-arginine translocase TatA/TatE family subunit [Bacillus tianshenii]MBM7621611.1 sec-independent protein translocase protein TatA [Bacillus tianshenii]